MSAYGSFPRSLLLPEGGRCGTFLVCSCKSIVHELHTQYLHACVWIKKDSKPFTLQVPCDPNTRSINMAKKGAKKAAAEAPAPKAMKATDIPAEGG